MAKDGGLGLIINFSAGVIVSNFDDIIMQTGRVQKIKEYFDGLREEVDREEPSLQISRLRYIRRGRRRVQAP